VFCSKSLLFRVREALSASRLPGGSGLAAILWRSGGPLVRWAGAVAAPGR